MITRTVCYIVILSVCSLSTYGTEESLPKVLIIGDSISIGYTPAVAELLEGSAEVVHNAGNARHTEWGRERLDEWLGDTKWDVIHFNFGLHDLKYVDESGKNVEAKAAGHIQVPIDRYRENLEAIISRLEKTGATLVFATTTPVPDGVTGPFRESEAVEEYNRVALEVMAEHNVAIADLCGFVRPRLSELQRHQNVHFTDDGYRALGEEVAEAVRAAISRRLSGREPGRSL